MLKISFIFYVKQRNVFNPLRQNMGHKSKCNKNSLPKVAITPYNKACTNSFLPGNKLGEKCNATAAVTMIGLHFVWRICISNQVECTTQYKPDPITL